VTTDSLTPAELAAFDRLWHTTSQTLDNLLASYREMTSDGEATREVDLILFASALPETVSTEKLGALLACAIARLAAGTEEG
jgi:hypothetical protein